MTEFAIKDSGARQEFSGGMVRDTTEGKVNFLNVRIGPMLRRWAEHLTKGRQKYPDPEPGVPNWTLAEGVEEFLRAKESAARHFEQWLAGDRDEDHAAGVFFNINLAEYVLVKAGARGEYIDPGLGSSIDVTPKTDLGGGPAYDFRTGDRVEVVIPGFPWHGERGGVVGVEASPFDVGVRLDDGRITGFYSGELKPVKEGPLQWPECNGHCLECHCAPEGLA